MDRERTRLVAVGQRHKEIGQLGVGAALCDEPFDIVAPAPSARLAEDGQRGFANIGQGDRPVGWLCEKIAIRDHGLISRLVNDILGIKRAAIGQSNAKGIALALRLPLASTSVGCASARHENGT
jgi:hypothetical protein